MRPMTDPPPQVPLQDMVTMLICDDVQESIRFYVGVLGFTVTKRMDDIGRSGWASVNHGRIQMMLASPHFEPQPQKVDGRYPQAIYYFYPADVVALRDSMLAAGYEVSDLRVTFYGNKEFDMLDPSGHVLWFGQETDEKPTVTE
jgi:uncharacterized glyoxalase superfamily protein PhnB